MKKTEYPIKMGSTWKATDRRRKKAIEQLLATPHDSSGFSSVRLEVFFLYNNSYYALDAINTDKDEVHLERVEFKNEIEFTEDYRTIPLSRFLQILMSSLVESVEKERGEVGIYPSDSWGNEHLNFWETEKSVSLAAPGD